MKRIRGVHGANRLGGNGVANSTVFGGIAGDTMAQWVGRHGAFQDPNAAELAAAVERAEAPFNGPATAASAGAIEQIRETLFTTMWDDAGIVRDAEGLARAADVLDDLSEELSAYRLPDNARDRSFNLTWHDALNLANLVNVSQVIVRAARTTARTSKRRAISRRQPSRACAAILVARSPWRRSRCISRADFHREFGSFR